MVHDILAPAPFTPSNRSFVISSIITASTHGSLGLVMLRRPEAINALTLGMLEDLTRIFTDFRSDNKISMVILQGAGARGFCAGGDIKDFHAAVSSGEHQRFLELLRLEFALDEMIANYPKPVITMVHGLCMGGGIGLASHASIRITTPEARFALPEARIGYSPDVGSTLLMARAPGHVGEYLALTGTSFTGADAVELGFADMMVSQDRFEEIFEALPDFDSMPAAEIAAGIEVLFGFFAASPLASQQPWIDAAFCAPTVPEIIQRLSTMRHPAAAEALAAIQANSPTSLHCALGAVRAARTEDHLRSALDRELRVAEYLMYRGDLTEGIRAQVIDKDRSPRWSPLTVDPATEREIAALITVEQ